MRISAARVTLLVLLVLVAACSSRAQIAAATSPPRNHIVYGLTLQPSSFDPADRRFVGTRHSAALGLRYAGLPRSADAGLRARFGDQLDDLAGRLDLHLRAAAGRHLPRWHAVQRAGGRRQPRPHHQPDDRFAESASFCWVPTPATRSWTIIPSACCFLSRTARCSIRSAKFISASPARPRWPNIPTSATSSIRSARDPLSLSSTSPAIT